MKTTVRSFVALGFVGSTAFAAPFLAIGDNAELFVTGTAGVSYNDNIFLVDSGSKADTIANLTPGVNLEFGKESLVKGTASLSESLSSYLHHSELNSQLTTFNFNAAYTTEKSSLAANASYTQFGQNVFSANGSTVSHNVATVGLNGEHSISPKTSFGAGFNFSRTEYTSAGSIGDKNYGVPLNVFYEITPKVDLSAGLNYNRSETDNGLSYNDYYYNVGARGEFTPKLSGNLTVGMTDRNGSGTGAQSSSGLSFHSGLSYAYSEKTSFTLGADKGFSNSSTGGTTQKNTSFTLGGSTDLSPKWSANASLGYRIIEYIGSGRTDNYVEASIGASYVINTNVSLSASITHSENASDAPSVPISPEFTNNVVSLSISARY